MVLGTDASTLRRARARERLLGREHRREIQATALPVRDADRGLEQLRMPDRLLDAAEPEFREVPADIRRDEPEELLDELRLARESFTQFRILRRDTHRARVEVAHAHHDATSRDQWRGGEPELLRPEQHRHHDVACGAQATVALHRDPIAKSVEHQRLLRVGEAHLPRESGVLEGGERRCAGAAVVPGDEHHVGMGLADPGRDRPDTDRTDELDVDAGVLVRVLEVVDELGEVLDGVDVVVRRRRDQSHPRRRMPGSRDPRIDLERRELAALTGLGALCHLDLDVGGVDEVVAGDTESPARDLFDGAAPHRIVEAVDVFPALTRVRAAPEPVHCDRHRLVCLRRDRAVAHGAGVEPREDRFRRLHLLDRHGWAQPVPELEQSPQRPALRGQAIDLRAVLLEDVRSARPGRVLQQEDRLGGEQVQFAVAPVLVDAADVEPTMHLRRRVLRIRGAVPQFHFAGEHVQTDTAETTHRPGEVLVDHLARETDGLENLCGGIRPDRRNAHLGHHLEHTLAERAQVVPYRDRRLDAGEFALGDEVLDRLHRQVRVDRRGTASDQ